MVAVKTPCEAPHLAPVAIVGMGIRLPGGVNTADKFWDMLIDGKDAKIRIPNDRYNVDAFYAGSKKPGTVQTEYGHFLQENIRHFDPSFFSMTRAEVMAMDPQSRMLLEVTREAFENAGEADWSGKNIGCYIGTFGEDWHDLHIQDKQDTAASHLVGGSDFALSNRISYEYNLKGPSLTVKSACSSSMVAFDLACKAIASGQCTGALVGGCSMIVSPSMTVGMFEQGVLAADGACKTFDAAADGYGRGEAFNVLYVKSLSEAIRDGNPIRAVIRATASNCDGKSPGISHPSSEAHQVLMRTAAKAANLPDLSTLGYVEGHGTGTGIGDPVEMDALYKVFGDKGVYVGSCKPNFGHSEGASATTGIIKVVLALQNRTIPPNIRFNTPNPKILFGKMMVPTTAIPWPEDREEIALVNAFGVGGANATVILHSLASFTSKVNLSLEPALLTPPTSKVKLLVFSANHPDSLRRLVANSKEYLDHHPERAQDLAYSLGARREHLPWRSYCLTGDSPVEGTPVQAPSMSTTVNFIFSGQGGQWPGMGRELLLEYPEALNTIQAMDAALQNLPDGPSWSLKGELLGEVHGQPAGSPPERRERLSHPELAQPLTTAIQIVIVSLLRSWGITPGAVVGHSSGEMAAAYAAGIVSQEEAVILAYYRGLAVEQQSSKGSMVSVGLGWEAVSPFLKAGTVVACDNSPGNVTLSGDSQALDEVVAEIQEKHPDAFVKHLKVSLAYHSEYIKPAAKAYEGYINGRLVPKDSHVPFYSTVTGALISHGTELNPKYWRHTMESPVMFHAAMKSLLKDAPGHQVFLGVGPQGALQGPIRQILAARNATHAQYVSTLVPNIHAVQAIQLCLGQLFLLGIPMKFEILSPGKVLTDMAPYPWHHDTDYWSESRTTKEWLHNPFKHHDLLGSRVPEASQLEPLWRNMLRVDVIPWIQDHVVSSSVVFPGAGYVAMVGEAIRQLSGMDDFTLTDVTISSAIMVDENNQVELLTSLRPVRLTATLDSTSYEFLSVPTRRTGGPNTARGRCYQTFEKRGISYGPRFRRLREITTGITERTAHAKLSNISDSDESTYQLHPTIIDNCFQLFSCAESYGLPRNFRELCVPSFIESLYIAPSEDPLEITSHVDQSTRGGFKGGATGTASDGEIVFHVEGLALTSLDNNSTVTTSEPPVACSLEWHPDIDFLPLASLVGQLGAGAPTADIIAAERLALLCTVESSHLLAHLPDSKPHLNKYRSWLKRETLRAAGEPHLLVPEAKGLVDLNASERRKEIESLSEHVLSSPLRPYGLGIRRVFDSCVDIFQAETQALELLVQDGVIQQIYNVAAQWNYHDFFTCLSHARPWLRVLEIGAGTGGTSASVLPHLVSSQGECLYSLYHYTDISSGFFSDAKNRFHQYQNMHYSVLDISEDPERQGFASGSYDVIIAANVLHATLSLSSTLKNAHQLLRPDGYLVLDELCATGKMVNYVMGGLTGWWLGGADGREWEPYVTPGRWTQEMKATGFIEPAVVYDMAPPYQTSALLITRPQIVAERSVAKEITILCDGPHYPSKLVDQVEADLQSNGCVVNRCTLVDKPPPGHDIISFLDVHRSFFDNITEPKLRGLIAFLRAVDPECSILWCTRSSQIDCHDPRWAQTLGFARTVRSELAVDMATLELDVADVNAAAPIFKVWTALNRRETNAQYDREFEWVLNGGTLYTGRFHWYSMSEGLAQRAKDDAVMVKRLTVGSPGLLDSLKWHEEPPTSPGYNEVVVDVRAVGMNFVDLLMAQGVVASPSNDYHNLGTEGAGIILAIGPDVTGLAVGDRVMVLVEGCHATSVRTKAHNCVPIPPDLSLEEAATMPSAYTTVVHSLIHLARLQKGQSVLIHSACGGTGNAAIQISRMIGAEIYVTVGSDEKITYLKETYGISRERIFHSRDSSFLSDVLAATNGRGVDVVLNSLSGELLHASWKCVAPYGCMLELGKRDFIGKGTLAMEHFAPNRAFFGVDVQRMRDERPGLCHEILRECMGYYEKGLIGPVQPIQRFPATDIQAVFRFMQKGTHMGKLVVQYPDTPHALPGVPQRSHLRLKPDASYLLAGGLGGLGRAVATWMAEHGAKHLIFLSRRAGHTPEHKDLFRELETLGCQSQACAGSVSSLDDVRRAVEGAKVPVAGILQLSMVLKDVSLDQMTISDWETAIKPKVDGTWNLHKATKHLALDFMVLFSSSSGLLGLQGQANYASGNTFQDAFVQYRRARGLSASVLDIGVTEGVGYVSEHKETEDRFKTSGKRSLTENDLLDALHLAIVNGSVGDSKERGVSVSSQIALAIGTPKPLGGQTTQSSSTNRQLSVFHGFDMTGAQSSAGSHDNRLTDFIVGAKANPSILNSPDSALLLAEEIGHTLYDFLLLPTDSVDTTRSIKDLGVDSLVAIELRNWCRRRLGMDVTILDIMNLASVNEFGELAARRLYSKYSSAA